jgi:hypothetical protein
MAPRQTSRPLAFYLAAASQPEVLYSVVGDVLAWERWLIVLVRDEGDDEGVAFRPVVSVN